MNRSIYQRGEIVRGATDMPSASGTYHMQHCGVLFGAPQGRLFCELCGSFANTFCHSDEALLCQSCDSTVHRANFLASRHVRAVLCSSCSCDTALKVSGPMPAVFPALCSTCHCSYHGVNWFQPCSVQHSGQQILERPTQVEKRNFGVVGKRDYHFPLAGVVSAPYYSQRISPMSVLSMEMGSVQSADSSSYNCTPLTPECFPLHPPPYKRARIAPSSSEGEVLNESEASLDEDSGNEVESPEVLTSNLLQVGEESTSSIKDSELVIHNKNNLLGVQATARLQRVLANWHRELCLSGEDTCSLAFHLLKRSLMKFEPGRIAPDSLRVNLAACLWIATKFDENQTAVRKAPEVSRVAGVDSKRLVEAETVILNVLNWRPLEGWNRPSDIQVTISEA